MDLIAASASNQVAFADPQIRAHRIETHRSDLLWTCIGSGPGTEIHNEAITLAPLLAAPEGQLMSEVEQFVSMRGNDRIAIMDWWKELDLRPLGFDYMWNTDTEPAPYLYRAPGDLPPLGTPPELEIVRVTDPAALEQFEEASFVGYEHQGEFRPGRWHHRASLDDAGTIYFSGIVDGRVVSTSIGVISDGVVGIFGVATRPQFRHRGYGRAVTWAVIQTAPDLPAVLGPSDSGEPLYRSMGFKDFHSHRMWQRPASI